MPSTVRRAEATWEGDLASGEGVVSAVTSGVFTDLPVTWASRAEEPEGRTSPEELVAAAHAACYCMALSNGLGKADTPPTRLEVSAEVTFEVTDAGARVASSALTVIGDVPRITASAFEEAAEAAKDGCPISKALVGNVDLSVEATLAE